MTCDSSRQLSIVSHSARNNGHDLASVMPPRRSSRTRTFDAQPTSAGSSSTPSDAITGKRKRGQSVAEAETDTETETVIQSTSRSKPASSSSRTRAKPASTASTSRGRASVGPERTRGSRASTKTRATGRLKEVPEVEESSDGEDEEQDRDDDVHRPSAAPPRKKLRKSVEGDEEEGEPVRQPSRRGRSRQAVKSEGETDSPPASKARRSSAKPPSSKTTKTTRSSRRPVKVESDVEEEEEQEREDKEDAIPISDDEDALPVQRGGSRKAVSGKPAPKQSRSTRKYPSKPPDNVEIPEQEEEEEVTIRTPRPSNLAPATPRRDPTSDQAIADEEEDGLDGFDQEYKGSPLRAKRQDANKSGSLSQAFRTPIRAPSVEEEEKSLLEPRVRPQTQLQPPPIEEVKGPKSRLVIHKMVLVNFKSYAGRQEIGPFHKVRVRAFESGHLY